MKRIRKLLLFSTVSILFVLSILTGCGNNNNGNITEGEIIETPGDNPEMQLTILATSDMHDYLMNYDYYTGSESDNYGLVKLATLINNYRAESNTNSIVLVDNGDLIQGNPLGDYFARVNPTKAGEKHPIYVAFEALGYDAAGIGNHEFNYGLDYLHQIIKDTTVPVINANVYNATTGENEFQPYTIITKTLTDDAGNNQDIKVGIISFVPTQILNWDKMHLEGKVTVEDIRACAEKFIPQMKEEGADIIVALAHSGYGSDGDYVENAENMAYHLTMIDGIDVVVGGHSHETFPEEGFVDRVGFQNVDINKGTINGTFTVQPTKYAEGLGVVTLNIVQNNGVFAIADGVSQVVSAAGAANDANLEQILLPYHEQVIEYVNSPVGELAAPVTSYFALIGDDASVQIVSDAQIAYGKQAQKDAPELQDYRDLPVLSAAAPFKAGLSKGGTNADDYVDIPAGGIAIKDVANLYKYPNTVTILKLTGKEIREWLEMSAGMFNLITEGNENVQVLLNESFPAFNFDTIDGVTYEVDVTQSAKYDENGNLINPDSARIVDLEYNGEPVRDDQEFLVVTNNYRAGGGGNFPIFTSDKTPIVYASSDETRQIVSDYIASQGSLTAVADQNWRIKPVEGDTEVLFISGTAAQQFLDNYPFLRIQQDLGSGLTEYIYKLNTDGAVGNTATNQ